jgi:hypothetical protein
MTERLNKVYHRENISFAENILKVLIDPNFYTSYQRTMDYYGEIVTSFSSFDNERGNPLEKVVSNYIVNLYDDRIQDFMKRNNLYTNGTYSWNCWWQMYDPNVVNSKHPRHDHYASGENVEFSFVHFLKTNGDKCFRFIGDYGENYDYVNEEDGDLIFFPSWAAHEVLPAKSGVRAVISGNIMITEHSSW